MRIPVCSADGRIIEIAGVERIRQMEGAPNVKIVRARKTGQVVRVLVKNYGDDSKRKRRQAHPLKYSHNHDTANNAENVWTLRHIHEEDRKVFRAVLDGCLSKVA